MSPESIQSMLRRSPFLPFRLHVANSTFIGILRNTDSEFWDVPVFLANEQIT